MSKFFTKYTLFYSTHFPSKGNIKTTDSAVIQMLWFSKFTKSIH